ncbi:MAG: tRNA (N(6)-L-threonylcarbamoyladenosine(37)-C(2))-methylthiotransferase MtaB [Oscillospiraceae bacterium]|nr:tRNA (N(6)-L-threonylcarbamoyladenosine(37)-C(2))-methylthiotransferase MtaB [Oscillospiraceae bacterium]
MPTAAFYTLGCKVNQCESAALAGAFAAAGFAITQPSEPADVYVINSCTVTSTGDKKSLQALRRFRRQNPRAIIALCGCLPQAFPEKAASVPEADIVLGTKNRASVLEAVQILLEGKSGRLVDIPAHGGAGEEEFERLPASHPTERTRAFLKIQDGCERECSYCIIPKARGPLRSRLPADIITELEAFIAAGYKEVVLSGVNLGCYGHDLGLSLIDAVRTACEIPGLTRIRLGSIEPDLLDEAAVAALKSHSDKLCDQFHLPLQSGCDKTLARMRRPYTTGDYHRVVELLREAFPGCAITTDIMTGFPGESEHEHSATLAFIQEVGFARAHIFCYSPRPGTPAAELPEQVPPQTAARRAGEITELTTSSRQEFLRSRVGKTHPVLFEVSKDGVSHGHTPCYTHVRVSVHGDLSNQILPVCIIASEGAGCVGRVAPDAPANSTQPL